MMVSVYTCLILGFNTIHTKVFHTNIFVTEKKNNLNQKNVVLATYLIKSQHLHTV